MKTKITITIDENVLKAITNVAESESRTISGLINKVLKDFVDSKTK